MTTTTTTAYFSCWTRACVRQHDRAGVLVHATIAFSPDREMEYADWAEAAAALGLTAHPEPNLPVTITRVW